MKTEVIRLTDEEKVAILEGAKELLGPNGENWAQGCWFGIKSDDGDIKFAPSQSWDRANTWCVMGAIEESAYRLGIIGKRETEERLAAPISLEQLVDSKEEWRHLSVVDVNDREETTFDTIRSLLDERLAQLKGA